MYHFKGKLKSDGEKILTKTMWYFYSFGH